MEDIGEIHRLNDNLSPDVLIVVEQAGKHGADLIAQALGWDNVYSYVSEWKTLTQKSFYAQEVAVFSKVPITKVIEYQPKINGVGLVYLNGKPTKIDVSEQLISAAGTLFYTRVEGWKILDALYFCVMTLTTIGYGDLHPTQDISKIFTMIYAIVGIGVFVALITQLAQALLEKEENTAIEKVKEAVADKFKKDEGY